MESSHHDGADDTDELLCTDVISDFGVCPTAVPRDHCDLLLDAIDAQLSRLQTSSHGQANKGTGKKEDVLGSVEPSRSGKEFVAMQEDKCEKHVGLGDQVSWPTKGDGGDEISKREQCLWRLERLLGAGTGVTGNEEEDEEDSVHTEDFSTRFLKEMLEPAKLNPTGSVLDSVSMSSDTTLLTEPQTGRQLAGVPLKSFDLVTIDSDRLWTASPAPTDRSELHKLQAQRDLYIQEVKALQESQAALQKHLTSVRNDNRVSHRQCNFTYLAIIPTLLGDGTSGRASALEREEMDRLLDRAKSELFSEQRRFRHTLDSLQEKLEEVTQELEQKQEQNKTLQEKCFQLEEKLNTATETRQELQEELLLLATQEEKNGLKMEIRAVREEHRAKLTAALTHAEKQKVKIAVEQEQRKWEEQRAESLREQRVRLEKQMQEVERRERAEVEKEKRNALSLQNKVLELQKEHVEELSSLTRVRLREDVCGDDALAHLRRQLRAKDEELRQVQRNMSQWKEKTTARIARKKSCGNNSEQRRRLEQLEEEMRHLTASTSDITNVPGSSASSAHALDAVKSHDLDSYKLLRHLQSRIRQLQADSQSNTTQSRTHTYTPNGVRQKHELSGSYLDTVCDIITKT
ncbi:hypothetical protein Baya_12865 [Bagarius yarrelli]|uniref:Uncharacterized protein n=1 Tax=Bagarius yarrelli TaxID=175774 RepID=A0A556V4P6_BAGYA|nr:hypothetical protein Baya_12865 [Bagarius yarrelli]